MLYTFSHYYLTTHIGRKASHDIYLSYPVGEPEHKVILKLYDPECRIPGTSAEDFLFTARRFKQLAHPHLIPIIDIGLEEGKPYVVSDYIANGSLRQRLEQRPANRLNLDEVLRIIQDIGTTIVYAHAHTIIHKDIRPENILFNEHDEALLGDFVLDEIIQERGIQHQLDAHTLNYMAPEQLNGISTPKSDQYALGCLLYELLTGTLPFGAGTGSLLDQQLTTEPTPPSTIVNGIPKAVETTILQALSHQQGERYLDVETFLNSLQTASRPAPPIFPFASALTQPSEEDQSQAQAAPFFDILTDSDAEVANPTDEVEEEDTRSTALASSAPNPSGTPGIGSPDIPSPRVMFPLMQQYSQQQDDTSSANDDQDDPFAYISTPIAAAQPEDKTLNRNAAQYQKANPLVLPASPAQPGQLAVLSQPSLFGTATPVQQNNRSYTLQPPSRRKANSFLLIALVSIILATTLSTLFNTTILALTATLPATENTLALKQAGTPQATPTQGTQVTPTATAGTQPTPAGSKKNPLPPKSNPNQGSTPTSTGGAKGNNNQPVDMPNGGQPGTNPNTNQNSGSNSNPAPTPTPKPNPPATTNPTPTPPPFNLNVTYYIVNRFSGKVLDDTNWSTSNGTPIQQWSERSGQSNQFWTFSSVGNGYYTITNQCSGLVLDDTNWSTSNGTSIQQWQIVNGQADQQWSLVPTGDGYYYIVNRFSGLVLDDTNWSTSDGTIMQQWVEVSGQADQEWALQQI